MSSYKGKMPTPFQAGCPTCSRLFGGVTGFDEHRKGGKGCQDPTVYGYTEIDGVWRQPMEQEKVALFKARVAGKGGRRRVA